MSTLVKRILEEEGVLGDVTLSYYNLQFIPTEEDVLSLEVDNAFKEIWVVSIYHRPGSYCFVLMVLARMGMRL